LISFRQHLVTIVAIFLALGIGVLMGTTVVKQGVVGQLKKSADRQVRIARQLNKQVAQLEDQMRQQSRFITTVEPALVKDQLSGTHVVMVTIDGVDPSEVDGVGKVLTDAGATVVATIVVTPRMALADPAARTQLAAVLGGSAGSPQQLIRQTAGQLGVRLVDGPGLSTPGATGQTDLLQQLAGAGFVAIRPGATRDPALIGGADQSFVLLSGNPSTPSRVDPASFLTPLVASVLQVDPGRPLVAAETTRPASPFVDSIRTDDTLDSHLVTVDDADTLIGQVAVALGLRSLQLSPGSGGDYGVSCGSCALIPSPGP
jgi:Copper transport outer membrane protein, MctB